MTTLCQRFSALGLAPSSGFAIGWGESRENSATTRQVRQRSCPPVPQRPLVCLLVSRLTYSSFGRPQNQRTRRCRRDCTVSDCTPDHPYEPGNLQVRGPTQANRHETGLHM
jgi:hypothetical protein